MTDATPGGTEHPSEASFFEGAAITELEGRLPAFTVDLPEGYQRGTHLRFEVEVRVKSVRYEERGKGGDLARQHMFAVEAVSLKSAFQPEDAVDSVGGSASAHPTQTPEEAAELGLVIGRSSDQWGTDNGTTGDVVGF